MDSQSDKKAAGPLSPCSGLLPYSGPRRQTLAQIGSPWSVRSYDSDQTGKCLYQHNSLGYRGSEYDPTAAFTVFIFGESDAFGLGVDLEDIWAVRVGRDRARDAGFTEEQTCVMNFAESGASNSLIARMLVTQCRAVKPNLVLVQIAEDQRVELIDSSAAWNGGPWFALPAVDEQIRDATDLNEAERASLLAMIERGRSYLDFCTPIQGLYTTLLELLLMHETTLRLGIETLVIGKEIERFFTQPISDDARLGPLVRSLRPGFLREVSVTQAFAEDSSGVDEHHMGPAGHLAIASHLCGGSR